MGVSAGVGYNFDRRNALIGEFMWNAPYPTNETLQPIRIALSTSNVSGHGNLFAFTGNYRLELRGKVFGTYFIGGPGWYHDIARYPDARLIPGLVLFRWDAPLFFANAKLFHKRVLDADASAPTPVRWLVVAAEPVTSVDVTAADALCELDDTLHAASVELCFAEMKEPVTDKLKRFGLSRVWANKPSSRPSAKPSAPARNPSRRMG